MDDVVQPAVEAPDRLARVARQGGGSSPAVEEGASEAAPALDPESFHDSGYRQVIRRLGLQIIDQEGPVTFDHLATRIARAHVRSEEPRGGEEWCGTWTTRWQP